MIYDLIRSQASILDVISQKVPLKKRGDSYIGLCPFHSEKTPSFTVTLAKRMFYCFGCHAGGDVISFVAEFEKVSYKQAALELAKRYNIALPEISKTQTNELEEVHQVLESTLEFFKSSLNLEVKKYLSGRGIDQEAITKLELGYAPGYDTLRKFAASKDISLVMLDKAGLIAKGESDVYEVFRKRIIFPIRNMYGKLIAFGGRSIDGSQPKYLNSPETIVFRKASTLYGEYSAYHACSKANQAIVVEGYMDAISMHMHGFANTVATMGTAVGEMQLDKIWGMVDEIIACFDGDLAGDKAAKKALDIALPKVNAQKTISFVILPEKTDPDDILRKRGTDYMKALLASKIGLAEMLWSSELSKYAGKFSPEKIVEIESNLSNQVAKITSKLVSKNYSRFFANKLWQLSSGKGKKISSRPANYVIEQDAISPKIVLQSSILSCLIRYPELASDEGILVALKNTELYAKYLDIANSSQKEAIREKIESVVLKYNPQFFNALEKEAGEVIVKLLHRYKTLLTQDSCLKTAKEDPDAFWQSCQQIKKDITNLPESQ